MPVALRRQRVPTSTNAHHPLRWLGRRSGGEDPRTRTVRLSSVRGVVRRPRARVEGLRAHSQQQLTFRTTSRRAGEALSSASSQVRRVPDVRGRAVGVPWFAVDLSMGEHWPRREDSSSCYGRGRSAARWLASTGDVFSATLSHRPPCGESGVISADSPENLHVTVRPSLLPRSEWAVSPVGSKGPRRSAKATKCRT